MAAKRRKSRKREKPVTLAIFVAFVLLVANDYWLSLLRLFAADPLRVFLRVLRAFVVCLSAG
jgi:hypothetical protein